ncbi:hypothetical protein ACSVH2_08660 [Flavobacterium sp. RSB2_4_14]|uniref:hypothetical protein n=1 Tax=Flavobacterium sp. RSB2_4_14 TaxID=3447665 RepID=UPI003F3A42AD
MTQNELDAYKKAIKQKYETEKTSLYSSLLLQPSRANLRKLCVERFKENQSQDDATTFKVFFGFEFGEGNLNRLKSETDRFRALENFLKNTTDCNDIEGINLIAILVDFTPRPFLKFAKRFSGNEEQVTVIPESNIESKTIDVPLKVPQTKKRKLMYGILGVTGLLSIGYTAKDVAFPEKECMQWQKDHYELVDCTSSAQQSFAGFSEIIPIDNNEIMLRRIIPSDTTVFFKNGEPQIWYCKINKKIECFNTHGKHPETGKALRPITKYIINKYELDK